MMDDKPLNSKQETSDYLDALPPVASGYRRVLRGQARLYESILPSEYRPSAVRYARKRLLKARRRSVQYRFGVRAQIGSPRADVMFHRLQSISLSDKASHAPAVRAGTHIPSSRMMYRSGTRNPRLKNMNSRPTFCTCAVWEIPNRKHRKSR
jgi:hypothetical protein